MNMFRLHLVLQRCAEGHTDTKAGSEKSDGSVFSERRGVPGYEEVVAVWFRESGLAGQLGQPGLSEAGHAATRAHANVPN